MKCAWNLEKENRNCQYCTVEGCEDRVATKVWSAASLGGLVRIHDSITYIRKDALLEKIDDAIAHLSDGSLTGYYESLAYKDIRELINSM